MDITHYGEKLPMAKVASAFVPTHGPSAMGLGIGHVGGCPPKSGGPGGLEAEGMGIDFVPKAEGRR